jgi:hypothetical protein
MQWHGHDYVESLPAKPFIIERCAEPVRYNMSKVNLPTVFELVNYLADDTATAVCGHRCVEMNRAMGAVGAGKRARDRALERFGAFLAKWRDDANGLCSAFSAKIFASSNAIPADCTNRWIEKRYGRFDQFKLWKRDHISTRPALLSR